MNTAESIRKSVSQTYAQALEVGTCCGGAPKGILAKQAGYKDHELAGIPGDAVTNAFGCGNPLSFAQVRPGDVVLDLGCGAGIDVVLAASRVGPAGRVIGVDMTDEMVARAREVLRDANLVNAEVRKGLIEDLPIESSSVDWVISNCVINLSPEKSKVFAEIARVLRPGGRVLVSDIIAENLSEEIRRNLGLYSCCLAGALGEIEYRSGLERAGLVDVVIQKQSEVGVDQFMELVTTSEPNGACCHDERSSRPAPKVADTSTARAWTASISARKP